MVTVKIGTRGSPLALLQAESVAKALEEVSAGRIVTEIVKYTTRGDQLTKERLTEAGGKGLFTKEIDRAVSEAAVDIGVHSLKDMPGELPEGQELLAVLAREDARDVFLGGRYKRIQDLPKGAVLGTASLRREAQLLAIRPDLKIVTFRGNVQTRLRKLEERQADATILAKAGLNRLKMNNLGTPIPMVEMLPACGQGIIAVTILTDNIDGVLGETLQAISDQNTVKSAIAERAMLKELDGDCRTPIAGHLFRETTDWVLKGEVLHTEGTKKWVSEARIAHGSSLSEFEDAGIAVGQRLRAQTNNALVR